MAKELTIEQRREAMRQRLDQPARERGRSGSVASDVRACFDIIELARIRGKTWAEIAEDMYGDENKADAVRAAYLREAHIRRPKSPDGHPETLTVTGRAIATGMAPNARAKSVTRSLSIKTSGVGAVVAADASEAANKAAISEAVEDGQVAHAHADGGGAPTEHTGGGSRKSLDLFGSMNDARDDEAAETASDGGAS